MLGQPIVFSLILDDVSASLDGDRRSPTRSASPWPPTRSCHALAEHRTAAVTRHLPIFPLGSVLMPTQFLPLHIFEPRYRELMRKLTDAGAAGELGVVLIERGHEVGGGDQRVDTGTRGPPGRGRAVAGRPVAGGVRRDRALPGGRLAAGRSLPAGRGRGPARPDWDPSERRPLAAAEELVREALALAAELGEAAVPAGFELSDDPGPRAWQLCAVAPLGPLDRQRLLEAPRSVRLVTLVASRPPTPGECLRSAWAGG